MTKAQLIRAIIERKCYLFTHDEMLLMKKKQLEELYERLIKGTEMKYIDAGRLKKEIERRIAAYQKNFDKADNKIAKLSTDGRIASLKGILPFITSLQQEQQEEVECEDLEEAAEHYADYNSRRWQEDGDIYYDHSKIKDAFSAGAEWQSKKEQETIKTAEDHAFLAGANWQKEQMMKGAAEGFIFQSADYYPKQLIAGYDGELGMGDKVRIIIVKDEEQ